MKALLDVRGRSPGGTGRRRCAAGDAHLTVPGHLAADPATTPAGRLVARRFRLRAVLGRGGMGRVWLADDEVLDRPVAVKQVLLHGLGSAEMRSEAWACALNEARSAARVDHEGAVRIYDIVEDDRCPWIVMEPLPGRTLQQALNTAGPLPARQVTEAGLRLLDVLQATHRAGIVHGDVKPTNVHLCGHGRVVLTDFGIACAIGDVWSATGVFTAVEGWPPFDRGSLAATLAAILLDAPAPFLHVGPLRPVIEGLLAKDPARRLSMGQARAAFRAIQREHGTARVRL
jgi:hypothetical protein